MKSTRKVWVAVPTLAIAATAGMWTGLGWAASPGSEPTPAGSTAPAGDVLRDRDQLRLQDGSCTSVPDLTRDQVRDRDGSGDGVPDVTRDQVRDRDRLHSATVSPTSVTTVEQTRTQEQVRAQEQVRTADANGTGVQTQERARSGSPAVQPPAQDQARVQAREQNGR